MNYIYELPTFIEIDGKTFTIRNKGDYRVIIDIMVALLDPDLDDTEKAICVLQIFYENYNDIINSKNSELIRKAIIECYNFIDCGNNKIENKSSSPRLMDWEQDAHIIIPAINRVAGLEVRALPYLHWWTFMGYYNEIGECSFSTIVGIRSKKSKGKKLEKWEQDYYKDNKEIIDLKTKNTQFDNEMLEDIMRT